jgi:xanthine/CO dehydrogenase XdhC/CoxF family maturation factor
VPPPLVTLQLYGAGPVGRAIVCLFETSDCLVRWIDEREERFWPGPAAEPAPHIERVCVEPVQAEVAVDPAGAFYLVLTHSRDLDLAITTRSWGAASSASSASSAPGPNAPGSTTDCTSAASRRSCWRA